ncbi:MAG TPA: GntR family transcriptional regulator [Thermoanaerobacterales bacterium]|nr:GntR family transcriptional regulator [Thermoanaerobacterales bacterium]
MVFSEKLWDNSQRYEIVLKKIKDMILSGELREEQKFPSETALAREFGVSRSTLREALRILEEEGFIKRYHGVGTFVSRKPLIESGMEELISITKLIEKQGMKAGTKDISIVKTFPGEKEASIMKISADQEIYRVERVRTADDIPVVYCIDRIPVKFVNNKLEFKMESLFDYLQKDLGIYISYAISDIVPVKADIAEVYKKLNLKSKSDVVLLLEQLHYDDKNNPIFYSSNYFSPDKIKFWIIRRRK